MWLTDEGPPLHAVVRRAMLMMNPRQNADLALAQRVVDSDGDSLHRLAANGSRPLLGLVPGATQVARIASLRP